MGYIAHLPKSVIGQLRSSSILSDLAQAVEELICNSLDAGATKICVDVDLSSFSIKVEDDGSGVTRDDLKMIGERHATSKLHDMVDLESGVSTLGFRGEALSSLSDVGVLEIITRVRGSPNTYKKIVKSSKKLSLGLYGVQRAPGTTVVLHDLFYNLPVRRKVIQSSPRKVLQGVRDRTMRLALIHPDVSFKIFDMDRQESFLSTKAHSSSLDTLCEFYGDHLRHELSELHFAKKCLKVDGFISKESSQCSSKAIQFLYLNGRFVHKTPVHKLINTLFLRGNCGHELGNPSQRGLSFAVVKQVYPMYLINLHCPLSSYDITFEATKTSVEFKDWKSILTFIREALSTKWSRLISNSDEDDRLAKSDASELKILMPRKRKLPWQLVDPTYHPRCGNKIPKAEDWFHSVGAMDDADHATKINQDFTFHIPKGMRTPRKRKAERENHTISESFTSSWSLLSCGARRRLDDDSRSYQNQCGLRGMDNPCCDKESFLGILGDRSSNCVQDDLLNGIVGLKSGASVKEVFCQDNSARKPVGDLDKPGTHCLRDVSLVNGSGNHLSIQCVNKKENGSLLRDCCSTESMHTMNDLQTSPHLYKSFSVCSPGVRRCLYQLDMKPSCTDSFLCHSERQRVSNLEIKYENQNREGLWNNKRDALSIDFPGCQFSRSIEGKFEEECQHDDMPFLEGIDQLSESESLWPQKSGINKFDFLQRETLNQDTFLGKVGKPSQEQLLLQSPADLVERFQDNELDISNFLPPSIDDVGKEIGCRGRSRSSGLRYSEQITSKDLLEAPKISPLQRMLSGPPFYQPPRKYGISVGLSTSGLPGEDTSRHNFQQATAELLAKAQTISSAVLEDCSQKKKQVSASSKDGHHTSTGMELTMKERGSQEDMLLCQDFDLLPAVDTGVDDLNSKWRGTIYDAMAVTDVTATQLYKNWKNPCIRSTEPSVLDLSSGILGPSNKHLLPESITKEALQNIQVLQQMDKKFIASVADKILVVVDQHAADERIRLEQLRKEVLEEHHLSTLLDYPKELGISMREEQLLHTYKAQVEEWGWRFKLIAKRKNVKQFAEQGQHGCSTVLLTAVPRILGESLINSKHLSEYLHQLMTTDGTSSPPPAIQRVLASKACRGAIMFGDNLLRSECQQLIEGLKRTALSFQCAHGRPTLVPIVNLQTLRLRLNRLHLKKNADETESSKIELRDIWHGLRWHRATLSRATERLQRAEEMQEMLH